MNRFRYGFSSLVLVVAVLHPLGAQSAPDSPRVTLAEAVAAALKAGDDVGIQQANLRASSASNAAAQAKNGFAVTVAGTYSASQSFNNPSNSSSKTAPNLYGSTSTGIAVGPSTAGSTTADQILTQSPTASVTAGTPLTSVTGSWTQGLQNWPDGTSRSAATGSVKVTQTLWNGYWGGPTQAAADKASLAFQIAQLNAQTAQNKTVLTVKQAYFTLLSAQENLNLLTTTLASRKTTLQFTQSKFALQQATQIDLLTAQVNERSAELDLADGQNALNTARKRLANLMGLPTDAALAATAEPDPALPVTTLDDAVALGLKNRTELLVANLNAQSSLVDLNLAAGASTPSVSVSGQVSDTLDLSASRSVVVGLVGLTLGAPLWDGGAAGASTAQAQKTRDSYLTQVHQLGRSIPVDIEEGWNAYQQAAKRYELAGINAQNFELQLTVTKAQLDAGIKTLADEFTAEINASTAEFGLLKAKITAQLAALQLQSLLGM